MSHTGARLVSNQQPAAARPKFNGPTKMRTIYIKTSVTNLVHMFNGEDFSGDVQLNIPPRLVQTGANISVKDRVLIIDGHRDQVREALFLIISKIYKLDRIRGGPCHVCILIPAASRQALIGPDALYHRLVCGFHGTTYSIKPDTQNLELVLKEDMTAAFFANINDPIPPPKTAVQQQVMTNGQKPSYQVSTSTSLSAYIGKPAIYEMLPVMLEGNGPVEVCATIMDLAELIGIFAFTRHQERMLKSSLTEFRDRSDALVDRSNELERTCVKLREESSELRDLLSVRQAATEDAAGRLQHAYSSLCCERDMWRAAVDQLDCRRRMELLRVGLRLQETETDVEALRARCLALESTLSTNGIAIPAHIPPMPSSSPISQAAPSPQQTPLPNNLNLSVNTNPFPLVQL